MDAVDECDAFLGIIRPNNVPVFSRQEYESFLNESISEKTARNDLLKLVEAGYLKATGKGALTKYRRTEKQLPDKLNCFTENQLFFYRKLPEVVLKAAFYGDFTP